MLTGLVWSPTRLCRYVSLCNHPQLSKISPAVSFVDSLIEEEIPLYCNVNIRSEFLEIHRRIIFSEAILDFEKECKKSLLPPELVGDLNSFRTRYERKLKNKPNETPLRLSEREIKDFKLQMLHIQGEGKNLWSELCEDRIGSKLGDLWSSTADGLGLNFLSLRREDQIKHLNREPIWDDVADLMSKHGLSSSDAMILNLFISSKFEVIASSDLDIAYALQSLNFEGKHAVIPDDKKVI